MNCQSCGHPNRPGASFCGACGTTLHTERECPSCGRSNSAEQRFCDGCGTPLAASTATEVAATPARVRSPTPQPSLAHPQTVAGGRYRIARFLGEGGRKRVYLAHDERLARDVAVSLVKTDGLEEVGLQRITHEAQAMGRLGDHPHIVTIHDVGEDAGQPYIVSQYMGGGDVASLLAAAPDGRLSVEEAARIGEQVCLALEHAHARGIVHRDIKAGNVWLTEDGVAKLGDFGLAMAADRARVTAEGMMLGTVAYMPPEQALGHAAEPRSDLYSLGALLYEMAAGRPPFAGDDAVAVISQHINTVPVTPSWHNGAVPVPLDELILDLLEKAPDDRPPDAAAVRSRLREAAAAPPVAARDALPAEAPRVAGRTSTPFVGRDGELATLREALDEAVAGRGSLRMLVGEPGIGKTRLAGQLGVYARVRGAQPLTGRCYEGEGGVPYMPWVEALRSYVRDSQPDALRDQLGTCASDIAKLVPEVRELVPDVPPSLSLEPEQERFRLFDSVSTFLVNASRGGPLLIVLEDLHWADKPSLLLLQHLVRRVGGERLLLLGTYRDVDLDRRHPLSEVLSALRAERLYERVLLRGFQTPEVVAMLEGAAQHRMDPRGVQLAEVLQRETEGNPFFIEEIVRHLIETGAIYPRSGRWMSDVDSMEDLGIPEGIREVIGRRLSRLSEGCNRVLGEAAVLGREFDFGVLATMSEMGDDELLAALEEALEAQLVVEVPDRSAPTYAFTHALVRETLYEELSLPRKQRLHARAGDALETAHDAGDDRYVAELALHHRFAGAAGNSDKALEYAMRAGAAAQAVFAWEEALGHYEAALEILEERRAPADQRARLMVGLGDLTYVIGTTGASYEKGFGYLERALALYDELGDEKRAAQVHSRLGRYLTTFQETMDIERAREHFRIAERVLSEDEETASLCYVYIGLASAALWGMHGDGLAASTRAIEIAERLGSGALWPHAAAQHGYHLWASGRIAEGIELGNRAWAEADRLNHAMGAFVASWTRTPYAFCRGDFELVRQWNDAELAKPRLEQAPQLRQRLLDMSAQAHIWNGELDAAAAIFAGFGPTEKRELSYAEAIYELFIGDIEVAHAFHIRTGERAAKHGDRWGEQSSAQILGLIAELRGDLEESVRHWGRSVEIIVSGPTVPMQPWLRTDYAMVLSESGRVDEAAAECEILSELLANGADWGGMASHTTRALGVVAAARGDLDAAARHFAEGIAAAREWRHPWKEGDLEYRWGLALSRTGDRSAALPHFDASLDIHRRLGASAPWLERVVAAKLAAQGVRGDDVQTSIDEVASLVEEERPDLRSHAAPDGTVTLMFSDIEGSTAMTERLGDERWIELLREHNAIVRKRLAEHGGFEVKSQGDGFMIAFASARRALECAGEIQRAFAVRNAVRPEQPLRVRIGLHTGEAIREGDDFFGRHVNLAARVAAQAEGTEVLVTSLLKDLTAGVGQFRFDSGRDAELKGFAGVHRVFALEWDRPRVPGGAAA